MPRKMPATTSSGISQDEARARVRAMLDRLSRGVGVVPDPRADRNRGPVADPLLRAANGVSD